MLQKYQRFISLITVPVVKFNYRSDKIKLTQLVRVVYDCILILNIK